MLHYLLDLAELALIFWIIWEAYAAGQRDHDRWTRQQNINAGLLTVGMTLTKSIRQHDTLREAVEANRKI